MPSSNYPQSTSQVITNVNAALASNNRDTMLNLAVQTGYLQQSEVPPELTFPWVKCRQLGIA